MPATDQKTDIRLMRGSSAASESWIPNPGEPLIDLESMTLNFGDGVTPGGIPINSVTCHILEDSQDLNNLRTYGRFFLETGFTNGPAKVEETSKAFLTIKSPDIGQADIWQCLEIVNGNYIGLTFNRISNDQGATWTEWLNVSRPVMMEDNEDITGGTGGNLNTFQLATQTYITDMTNGPAGTNGCDGILVVYRGTDISPYIYQFLYIVKCAAFQGRMFYRYSVNANADWNAPGYDWKEMYGNYLERSLDNILPTAVLQTVNGGTGRNNGTIAQADVALKTYLSDLAEYYISKDKLLPGELVSISRHEDYDIEKTTKDNIARFLGVVSTNGFYLGAEYEDKENAYPIARIGRVPAMVFGKCKKGDSLGIHDNGYLAVYGKQHFCFANQTKLTDDISLIEVII